MKIVSFINPWQWDVTLSRLYRDGGPWKSSDSFGRDDLLLAAKVRGAANPASTSSRPSRTWVNSGIGPAGRCSRGFRGLSSTSPRAQYSPLCGD